MAYGLFDTDLFLGKMLMIFLYIMCQVLRCNQWRLMSKNLEIFPHNPLVGGKSVLFWAKLFDYPHILLSDLEMENEIVIDVAKRFMYH